MLRINRFNKTKTILFYKIQSTTKFIQYEKIVSNFDDAYGMHLEPLGPNAYISWHGA